MFMTLLALGIAVDTIFTVDVESGEYAALYDDTGPSPDGVQTADGVVYWTTMGRPIRDRSLRGEASLDYSQANGGVHAVNVDGNDRRDLVEPGEVTTGKQLALADGGLYWGDREGHRVSRARIDGRDRQDLVVNPAGIGNQCVGVAVDGDYFYWTQKGPSKGGEGKILRAPILVDDAHGPASRTDIEVLWTGLPEPIDLEIVDGVLYWTDRGAPPSGNTLNRADLPAPGRRGASPEILADGFGEAVGLAVDADAGVAYASDLASRIFAVPLAGGDKRLIADLGTRVSGIVGLA